MVRSPYMIVKIKQEVSYIEIIPKLCRKCKIKNTQGGRGRICLFPNILPSFIYFKRTIKRSLFLHHCFIVKCSSIRTASSVKQ